MSDLKILPIPSLGIKANVFQASFSSSASFLAVFLYIQVVVRRTLMLILRALEL